MCVCVCVCLHSHVVKWAHPGLCFCHALLPLPAPPQVPSIQQTAALALGRLANYSDDLAEAVVANEILPQLVYSLGEQNVCFAFAVCSVHAPGTCLPYPRLCSPLCASPTFHSIFVTVPVMGACRCTCSRRVVCLMYL